MIAYTTLKRGRRFEIRAIRRLQHDASLLRQYITDSEIDESDRQKMVKAISFLANHGTPSSREKYRKLQGQENLHELKVKPHRLVFFFDGQGVAVFTHGFAKRDDNTPDREIARAEELREAYLRTFGNVDR